MAEIPESLLRRSAEAKAKALGVPVEDVLAEMKGEGPPVKVPQPEAEEKTEMVEVAEAAEEPATEPVEEVEPPEDKDAPTPEVEADTDQDVVPEEPKEATYADEPDPDPVPPPAEPAPEQQPVAAAEAEETPAAVAVAEKDDEEPPAPPSGNGAGNGKVASVVSPRPSVPPAGTPEGVRSQRLLTVVKARAIQNVKAEPTDKVNTWPHLMLMEFGALLLITGILVVMSIVIHSPLLDPANFNATPNPSKAPWYFLGLQELLSYFDPQIAGVMVPTVTGMALFILVPYLDKNPSTTPSDRKFAIALYSMFLAGAATLTIIGVLFRGLGFNWAYPWQDGIFFDDLKDWVHFE